jgi:hypothetical protein
VHAGGGACRSLHCVFSASLRSRRKGGRHAQHRGRPTDGTRPALPPVFRLYGFDEAAGAADEWTQALPRRWPGTFMSSLFGWDPLAGRCEHTCADVPCASLRDAVTRCAGCIGAGYACRLSTLPNVAFATFKGGWHRGHCANWAGRLGTKSGVEGDCYQSGASGSWANRTEMREVTSEQGLRRKCRELCAACPRCAVVSASFTRRDCSWYATCHRPLQRRSASGRVYSCLRMRHDITAATNPNETAAAPHNSVGRASGIASGSKGCSVSSFPPSVPCSRPHMAAWYLAHEKGCRLWPPGRGADLYQFGVPSSMTTLARLLEAGGRLDEGLFHTYWYICQAAARPSALRSHRARAPCIAALLCGQPWSHSSHELSTPGPSTRMLAFARRTFWPLSWYCCGAGGSIPSWAFPRRTQARCAPRMACGARGSSPSPGRITPRSSATPTVPKSTTSRTAWSSPSRSRCETSVRSPTRAAAGDDACDASEPFLQPHPPCRRAAGLGLGPRKISTPGASHCP